MRKTKVVCTLGPATDAPGVLRDMIESGMDVARFNFSHGSHEEHRARFEELKRLREELHRPVATLLDTKGPEIRLGHFEGGRTRLEMGQSFTLTTRQVMGSSEICSISYKNLPQDVQVGTKILLDDGLISMVVTECGETDIVCYVENGGPIKDRKGVNIPGMRLSMPYMSQQDKEDILFGIAQGFDFVAASFCRDESDVLQIRGFLEQNGGNMHIIAKLENQEGVDNIAAILAVSDGVMIARGDMGVEINFAEIPVLQKKIISLAQVNGKTVITATQMLESMIENPRPTRAEITDVANAVYDGTSAVMLSGETAAGRYPVEALRTMVTIANRTEADINYFGRMLKAPNEARLGVSGATAHAACTTATDAKASAIVTITESGTTARRISKYRPATPIIACVTDALIRRRLAIVWGVTPILMPRAENMDEMIELSVAATKEAGLVNEGDIVVITAGVPANVSGTTNMMKVHMVGGCLASGVGVGNQNATGRLCVCRNAAEARAKFVPGDVLVVPHTNNEMLPLIAQAAAVVAEQGGLSSHAAVVGLSTGKAVIISATNATKTLQDGAYVSLDCKRGIVQMLDQE